MENRGFICPEQNLLFYGNWVASQDEHGFSSPTQLLPLPQYQQGQKRYLKGFGKVLVNAECLSYD